MRLTVLGQYAKGVAQVDDAEGARLLDDLGRLKWRLWHGDIHRALEETHDLEDDVGGLELAYPNLGRLRRAMHEFAVYIADILVRADYRQLAGGALIASLRQHRLRSPDGSDVIDLLIRLLQTAA